MKKLVVCLVLIFGIFLIPFAKAANKSWRNAGVEKVLDNQHLQLFDKRIIKLANIDVVQEHSQRKNYQCIARSINRILKLVLKGKQIKLFEEKDQQSSREIISKHLKTSENINLGEFLLEKGFATYIENEDTKYRTKYKKAEESAKEDGLGIWSHCGKQTNNIKAQLYGDRGKIFKKKFGPVIAPVASGVVKKVLSGNSFELTNGLKVKLLGTSVPHPADNRKSFACFGDLAKTYLKTLIEGKEVFLIKDYSDLNESRELLRYVSLPFHNKAQDHLFINKKMIKSGFARVMWESSGDKQWRKTFEELENNAQLNLRGAWGWCLEEILK